MQDHFDVADAADLVVPVAKTLATCDVSEIERMRLYCCYPSTEEFIERSLIYLRAFGWASKTGYKLHSVRTFQKSLSQLCYSVSETVITLTVAVLPKDILGNKGR